MTLVTLHKIKKSFGGRLLLDIDHLSIHRGDRIGLVGANGSGKTTLLRLIAGEVTLDEGTIENNALTTYLPQLKENHQSKSGGEVTADYVVRALNEKSQLLLADEPTTHLDLSHIKWVEKAFESYKGAFITISHDRTFLDKVCDTIWELSDNKITLYKGNYTQYKAEKENEKNYQQTKYEKYVKKSRQLQEAITNKAKQTEDMLKTKHVQGNKVTYTETSNDFYQGKAKRMHRVKKSMETRLEKLEKVDKPKEIEAVKMELPEMESIKNRFIIRAFANEGKVPGKRLWKPATFSVKGGDKVGLIGANGSGKTTLIKKILAQEEDFTLSPAMKIGYFAQNLSLLDLDKSIIENVSIEAVQSETVIRIVLAQLHFKGDSVYKPVSVLSGGERVKVSLAKLLVGDYNTLILDEPTNFLDLKAVEALETLLDYYEGTLILVSHDRHFISSLVDKLWIIEDEALIEFNGSYKEWITSESVPVMDEIEEELMRIENELTTVLSDLSLNPSEEKDKLFQTLVAKKNELKSKLN